MSRAVQLAFVVATLIASCAYGTESADEPGTTIAEQANNLGPAPLPLRMLASVSQSHVPNGGSVAGDLPGDFDDDGDVDLHDFIAFRICMSFSSPGFSVPQACGMFDADGDGDIDLTDLAAFENALNNSFQRVLVDAGSYVPAVVNDEVAGPPISIAFAATAAHAGFEPADLWKEWSVLAHPQNAGPIIIENGGSVSPVVHLLPPTVRGAYMFELRATNIVTLEFGADSTTLELVECVSNGDCAAGWSCIDFACAPQCETNSDCDDELFCNGDESCESGVCVPGPDPCMTPLCDESSNQCIGTLPAANSGPAQACAPFPAECPLATVSLAESVPAACLSHVSWAQRPSDVVQVALVAGPVGSGSASFHVPRVDQLSASTTLGFTATVLACPLGNLASTEVSIQMAYAAWVGLPPCIGIHQPLDLDAYAVVTGQPPAPDGIVLVTVEENDLVDFDFNPVTNILEVNAGIGEMLTIKLQVFGTAGLLAEAVAQVGVGTDCP